MLISLLISVMSYQYGPDLVVVYANEAFYALLQGVLVNVIVNQNNTRSLGRVVNISQQSHSLIPFPLAC